MNCPNCNMKILPAAIVSEAARINGRKKSARKAKTSAINGKKGGRPPKVKNHE